MATLLRDGLWKHYLCKPLVRPPDLRSVWKGLFSFEFFGNLDHFCAGHIFIEKRGFQVSLHVDYFGIHSEKVKTISECTPKWSQLPGMAVASIPIKLYALNKIPDPPFDPDIALASKCHLRTGF